MSPMTSKVDVSVIQPSGNLQRGGEDGEGGGGIVGWISSLIFPALLVGGLLFLVRRYNRRGIDEEDDWISKVMEGGGMDGGSSPMDFGRSRSKVEVNPNTGVTFKEVAGCDQAKFELEEVIDFLRNPTKYTKVCIYSSVVSLLCCLCRTGQPEEPVTPAVAVLLVFACNLTAS